LTENYFQNEATESSLNTYESSYNMNEAIVQEMRQHMEALMQFNLQLKIHLTKVIAQRNQLQRELSLHTNTQQPYFQQQQPPQGKRVDLQRELPEGWECAADARGVLFFINHNNRTTTYVDPRSSQ
jgi:hypothetical protein